MKLDFNKLNRWVVALALVALAPIAQATIPPGPFSNGGFEIGGAVGEGFDFARWTPTGSALIGDAVGANDLVHSGSWSARFAYDQGAGTYTQTFDVLGDVMYEIEYWLNSIAGSTFSATVNGASINESAIGSPSAGWQLFRGSFTTLPLASEATLVFAATPLNTDACNSVRGCDLFVDDVSVTVPEPGTLLLVGAALAAGALVRRRKQG